MPLVFSGIRLFSFAFARFAGYNRDGVIAYDFFSARFLRPTGYLPIGYVHVETAPSFDLGYGLKKEFWRQGIVSEACRAIIRQAKACGIPYLTATHDRDNPHSGFVMHALGMRYCYSYEEMWQPKNFPVIFRLHQLDLDAPHADYPDCRARYENHFVEYELRHNDDLHFSQLLI